MYTEIVKLLRGNIKLLQKILSYLDVLGALYVAVGTGQKFVNNYRRDVTNVTRSTDRLDEIHDCAKHVYTSQI